MMEVLTRSIPATSHADADKTFNKLPMAGQSILICGDSASQYLCKILQSLGAQVFFYPNDEQATFDADINVASQEELLKLVLKSNILIENNANISRWLHAHGLSDFGKLELIVEQSKDGLSYWQQQNAPCQVVLA